MDTIRVFFFLPHSSSYPSCAREFITKKAYFYYNIIFDLYQYNIQPTNICNGKQNFL